LSVSGWKFREIVGDLELGQKEISCLFPEINSVFHGPTDYVIAQELKVLHSGDYKKDEEGWKF